MRSVLAVAALASACTSGRGAAPADLAPALETATCAQSLADYCSQNADCVADLTTALTTAWCSDMSRWSSAEYSTCGDTVVVWVLGVHGGGTGYIYDAATGALEAMLLYANSTVSCLAGPPTVENVACSGNTLICAR